VSVDTNIWDYSKKWDGKVQTQKVQGNTIRAQQSHTYYEIYKVKGFSVYN